MWKTTKASAFLLVAVSAFPAAAAPQKKPGPCATKLNNAWMSENIDVAGTRMTRAELIKSAKQFLYDPKFRQQWRAAMNSKGYDAASTEIKMTRYYQLMLKGYDVPPDATWKSEHRYLCD